MGFVQDMEGVHNGKSFHEYQAIYDIYGEEIIEQCKENNWIVAALFKELVDEWYSKVLRRRPALVF